MLFSDFLYRGAHHFQKQFVNAAGIPVFPEQGVPQPVQALDYEGGFLRRICDKVFLFLHLACLLCASIIYGGEDSRKCAIFRLGLSHEALTLLDFFGEIYSSAAKNLDFMRVCESVVMNIGTTSEQSSLCSDSLFKENDPPAPLLLLFRKKSRSHRLTACKRAVFTSIGSLPTFCGCACWCQSFLSHLFNPSVHKNTRIFSLSKCRYEHPYHRKTALLSHFQAL